MLSRENIGSTLTRWYEAWNAHDLDRVLDLFHDQVLFENFTGARVQGKEALRTAWRSWFENHGDFRFDEEETFIDESAQKALYRWKLRWPSVEKGYAGQTETRRGVDVMHFKDGKIIKKLTYSKTTVEIEGKRVRLSASSDNPTGRNRLS